MSLDRILVVCDDALTSKALQMLLASEGYEVRCTARAGRAWELLRAHPPQLLVVDAQLPEMAGLGLARRVKSDPGTRGIRVVVMTDNSSESHERAVLACGADRCVVTPVPASSLLFVLASQLRDGVLVPVPS